MAPKEKAAEEKKKKVASSDKTEKKDKKPKDKDSDKKKTSSKDKLVSKDGPSKPSKTKGECRDAMSWQRARSGLVTRCMRQCMHDAS